MNALEGDVATARRDEWFGQPRGLSILFLTEMWMQFSFFGMRTLLVYYMIKELMFPQGRSSLIYGTYAAAVYFTPIFGGWISDHWITKRTSVVIGGLAMAAGHFMMIFPALFFPALAAIALGNGFFLPSLSSQINFLYDEDDPRLASAYNIYYVGINLGAFLAPFVCGTIGEVYGWHWGFACAGVGMLIGLVTYLAGGRWLPPDRPRQRVAGRDDAAAPQRRRRFLLLLGVMAVVIVFRGAYEQNGNTIALWTDAGVDRHLAGAWQIPPTWFQSINPLIIFLGTAPLVAWWTRLGRKHREPASVTKMATGALIVAASFALIAVVALAAGGARAHWIWLVAFWVVLTLGELFILPVGLGLFGRLAPRGYEATAIAVWFFAGFVGNLLAGWLGSFWSRLSEPAFFAVIALTSLAAAVLLLPFIRPTARAEHAERRA